MKKYQNSYLVYCGVPQGSILRPTFSYIFQGIVGHVKYCDIIQFAGDTVILVSAKDV